MANSKNIDTTTEQKIKDAARTVFLKKGYSATRTRDIAEHAGINLALLNYYFRSKEKLFEIIMIETLQSFIANMAKASNDTNTTLQQKVEIFASNYIDFICNDPDIPFFILSEIRNNSAHQLLQKIPLHTLVSGSVFLQQYNQAVSLGIIKNINWAHFLMNIMGLVIFPFVGMPLLKQIAGLNQQQFYNMMQERKKLIPIWIKAEMTAT